MYWKVEAFAQNFLQHLPGGAGIYYAAQRLAGGLRHFSIDRKVQQAHTLLKTLQTAGEQIAGKQTMEIGTGWVPIIPLYLWLHGQESCHSYDINPLLRLSLTQKAVEQLHAYSLSSRLHPLPERQKQLQQLCQQKVTLARLQKICQFSYHSPADAGATTLPSSSVDVVYSNTVLEHISPPDIERVFLEAHRLLRLGGYMLHQIDLSDHFSHSDPRLSPINFLQFSAQQFSHYNNSFLYQNRWREPQFREIFLKHRFKIRYWEAITSAKAVASIPHLKLAREFANLSPEQLSITGIRVLAQK